MEHDITFSYELEKVTVKNIDPDRYSFLDLFDHALESFPIPLGSVLSFHSGRGSLIDNDKDLLRLFDSYKYQRDIAITIDKIGSSIAVLDTRNESDVEIDELVEIEVNPTAPQTDKTSENEPENEPEMEQTPANLEQTFDPANQEQPNYDKQKKKGKRVRTKPYVKKQNNKGAYHFRRKVDDHVVLSDEEFDDSDDDYTMGTEGADGDMDESVADSSDGSGKESDDGSESEGDWSVCQSEDEDEDLNETDSGSDGDTVDVLRGREKPFKGLVDENFEWREGLIFRDVNHIREVFKEYIVNGGYDVARIKNDKCRLTAICRVNGCEWRLHASILQDNVTFEVKKVKSPHTCERLNHQNSEATPSWIYKNMKNELRAQPDMPYTAMRDHLSKKYGLECKKWKLYKAKVCARLAVEGTHDEAYAKLIPYSRVLQETNPGSVIKFSFQDRTDFTEPPVFHRMFVALNGLVHGFLKGCRPFFGIDGAFLKGPFKGVLLAASTLDGNKGVFPIARCIAEGESSESWTWFLECLNSCIGDNHGGVPYTIMSDKQKVSLY